jgi:site-specific DNA recombinase
MPTAALLRDEKARARGVWAKSSVYEVLRNPKYTEYQVFNRRASRSCSAKVNDPIKWVWSTKPVHEPRTPKWMFDELNARRLGPMFGNHRKSPPTTEDARTHTRVTPRASTSARVTALRRARLQTRRTVLAADLNQVDDRAARERQAERERPQKALADITRRQDSILRQTQDGDPDDAFAKALRGSDEMEAQKKTTLAAAASLDTADQAEPTHPGTHDAELLDALPYLAINLAGAPDDLLRRLFEITQLDVRPYTDSDEVTITIKLPPDQLTNIAHATEKITEPMPSTPETPGQRITGTGVDAVRAPSRTRTCDLRIRSPLLCPAELWGLVVAHVSRRTQSNDSSCRGLHVRRGRCRAGIERKSATTERPNASLGSRQSTPLVYTIVRPTPRE